MRRAQNAGSGFGYAGTGFRNLGTGFGSRNYLPVPTVP